MAIIISKEPSVELYSVLEQCHYFGIYLDLAVCHVYSASTPCQIQPKQQDIVVSRRAFSGCLGS